MKTFMLWPFAAIFLVITMAGCSENPSRKNSNSVLFSFTDTVRIDSTHRIGLNNTNALRVAISAISSPRETFNAYHDMLTHIEEQLGQKVIMIQRKTYQEINDLMRQNKADVAIVCSGNYVFGKENAAFKLLVVPEWNGQKLYNTYIIVNKHSGIKSFEDLKGKRFAFTDPLSTSGKLYPNKRVSDFNSSISEFFESTIYTYAHDNSIQLVAKQMVDGASVNSLVFDYLVSSFPQRVKDIIIIEKSAPHAMPPVVISNSLPAQTETKLKNIFLEMHKNDGSKSVMELLQVDRYVIGHDTMFNGVRDLAGIPH